jgi:hypothetical protein
MCTLTGCSVSHCTHSRLILIQHKCNDWSKEIYNHTVISHTAPYFQTAGTNGWSCAYMVTRKQKAQSIHALDTIQINSHPGCVNVLQKHYLYFCYCSVEGMQSLTLKIPFVTVMLLICPSCHYRHQHVAIYSCCYYSQHSLNG